MHAITDRKSAEAARSSVPLSSELSKVTFGRGSVDVKYVAYPSLLAGQRKLTAGDGPGAELEYRRVVALDPDSSDAWMLLATSQQFQDKYAEAEQNYLKALALDPNSSNAFAGLGDVSYHHRRLPAALSNYRKALELEPGHGGALWGIALTYRDSGRPEAAIENFQLFLKTKPHPTTEAYARKQLLKLNELLESGRVSASEDSQTQ